jgi:SNF2 family DNA or RNA helicase
MENRKIDDILQIAEDYTTQILKTSLMMRDAEVQNKKQSRGRSAKKEGMNDPRGTSSKRKRVINDESSTQQSTDATQGQSAILNFQGQPRCLAEECQLQPHQLDSLKWMASLYENGVNGILADEMVSSQDY